MEDQDITKQRCFCEQEDGIVWPEFRTNKQTNSSGDFVEFCFVDECQQKTFSSSPSSFSDDEDDDDDDEVPVPAGNERVLATPVRCSDQGTSLSPLGYPHKSGLPFIPGSDPSQQPKVPGLIMAKDHSRTPDKRLNYVVVPKESPAVGSCGGGGGGGLRPAPGCKVRKRLDVTRMNKPVIFSIVVLFVISTVSLANVWSLRWEVRRLEEKIQQRQQQLQQQHGLDGQAEESVALSRDVRQAEESVALSRDVRQAEDSVALSRDVRQAEDSVALSRDVRQAEDVASGGKSRSKGKGKDRKKKKKRGKGKNLQVELYVGSWAKEYNPRDGQSKGKRHDLPGKPITHLSQSFEYTFAGTVIAFYQKDSQWVAKKKKKKNTDLMQLDDQGRYTVQMAGTYMLHLNITLKDPSHSKSIGIFHNNQVLFACPPGGIRCSQTNEKDSSHFRLCMAHGVAKLQVNDVVDIRTMDPFTVVKVKLQSQFWVVLLARH